METAVSNEDVSYQWLEDDFATLKKYAFLDCTLQDIEDFYRAKKAFMLSPNADTRYMMKAAFQIAHSGLKAECSGKIISPGKLQELTELLKKGV